MPDFSRFAVDCYLGELANSAADFHGFYPKLEVDSIVPTRELEDPVVIKSKARDTYGQNVYSEQQAGSIGLQIVLKEQPAWILAAAFAGNESSGDVTGASVTDESITIHQFGRKYKLAQRNVDDQSAVTVTGSGGTPTYTVDVDYTIDFRMGFITMIAGGAGGFSTGNPVLVDYTYKSITGTKILGEQVQTKPFQVLLDMKNRVSGLDAQMIYHQWNASAPDVLDLASDDFINITLEGEVITPTGKSSPYEYLHVATQA